MNIQTFTQEVPEVKAMKLARKLKNYYQGDFITDYNGAAIPIGRTLEQVLKTDNVIARTVDRYTTSVLGKDCSVEFDNPDIQTLYKQFYKKANLQTKFTTIARYQSLYGGAVVKLQFKFPESMRTETGYKLEGKPEDLIKYIDIAVFGMDKAQVRYDEYDNLESISIILGNRAEVFYSDRMEVFTSTTAGSNNWKFDREEPNTIGVPLAYFVPNKEFGKVYLSDVKNIIDLQEALNNALTQYNNNVTFHGTPQWYAKGLPAPTDDNGNHVPFRFGAGQVLHSEDKDADFGKIPVEGLEATAIDAITKQISLATHTLSNYSGNVPSGEALAYITKDFNALITDKQSKLFNFLEDFFNNWLIILDYLFDTSFTGEAFTIFIAGENPLQAQLNFQEALQLHSVNALSTRSLLNAAQTVDNANKELARIALEHQGNFIEPTEEEVAAVLMATDTQLEEAITGAN